MSRLIHGNCLKVMLAMPKKSVNLVFGSPPYENARDLKDDPFPVLKGQAWVDWMAEVYLASLRVSSGLVAYVVQGRTRNYKWSATPVLLAADLHRKGVHLRDFLIYHRVGIPGSGGPDWLRHDCEYILCATNGGRLPWSDNTAMGHPPKCPPGGPMSNRYSDGKRHNRNRKPNGSREVREYKPPALSNPGNLISIGPVGGDNMGSKLAQQSESPFPESLARFIILSFCPPNGTVLDPFCGSGTTCAVAKKENRKYIGIDIRKSQVVLSRVRLTKIKA